jgi:hypothetical protein
MMSATVNNAINNSIENGLWQTFIQSQGAVRVAGHVQHFGNALMERRAAAHENILVERTDFTLIRARGEEALEFLNAQLSNDIQLVDASRSQIASWCSPKGRMLVILRIFRRGEDYFLHFPAGLRETVLKRLRMYVLRAKVTFEHADSELRVFGLSGPNAENMLRESAGFAPSNVDGSETRGEITVIRVAGPLPRFEIIAPPTVATGLWEKLKRSAIPVGPPLWAWLDIMAGMPRVLPETSEAFVPQMANLEVIGGVNFKKGCYPGQEIVARMQYLGNLKQRMYRAHVDGDIAPRPGESIYAPNFPGQSAGTVVDAQASPQSGFDLLAVIQIGSATAGELHLGSNTGPRITVEPLPYSIPAGG